jgi:hypothetical protein
MPASENLHTTGNRGPLFEERELIALVWQGEARYGTSPSSSSASGSDGLSGCDARFRRCQVADMALHTLWAAMGRKPQRSAFVTAGGRLWHRHAVQCLECCIDATLAQSSASQITHQPAAATVASVSTCGERRSPMTARCAPPRSRDASSLKISIIRGPSSVMVPPGLPENTSREIGDVERAPRHTAAQIRGATGGW